MMALIHIPQPLLAKEKIHPHIMDYLSFLPYDPSKTRPLGIPCIWDRLIQQCIKQVMEPVSYTHLMNGIKIAVLLVVNPL